MTLEIILLALATTVRPTSLTAVYAIIAQQDRTRLMLAYCAAGLLFTVGFGVLAVWAFNGIDIGSGTNETKGIAEIIGGTAAIGFGVLLATNRISVPGANRTPRAPSRWTELQKHHISLRAAIVAGPATHLPGLFYLIALNL